MEQKLFTELRTLYETSKENPSTIRIMIRMRDLIEPGALRHAVNITMKRYPYFCVELRNKDGQYIFAENHREVVITNSLQGVELNSESSNFHMIAFAWYDNWIIIDVFHAMTDGAGTYEVIRTLLYYYCSERYHLEFSSLNLNLNLNLKREGTRLAGDYISIEEWLDPVCQLDEMPAPINKIDIPKALNLAETAGLQNDNVKTVYSVALSEAEFMKFNRENDGTPGTMTALFLSRAIAKLYPNAGDIIRITLTVNQRKALNAPLAHQTLVGGVMLEYKDKMRTWPLRKQATAYRGMVFAQTLDERVIEGVNYQKVINQTLLSRESDEERKAIAEKIKANMVRVLTAGVSYVGKANFGVPESYIRDFHMLVSPPGGSVLAVEISAVNGRFTIDISQPFSSPVYVNAFLQELDDNGITYDLQDVKKLYLPNIKLPWSM